MQSKVCLSRKFRQKTFYVITVIIFSTFVLTINFCKHNNHTLRQTSTIHTRFGSQDQPIKYTKQINDISCHDKLEGDELPLLGEHFEPSSKSIFMHETSCKGGLNLRQACAVESAARAHPTWQLYLLFSGPISKQAPENTILATLLSYHNVKMYRILLKDYAKGTPLQTLVESSPFQKSPWRVEHSSDALRYLTLYKFGGVYIDSDVVVVRPFDTLARNWAARQSARELNSALIAFSRDPDGRNIANATIHCFSKNYNPHLWDRNGPGVITQVVREMCSNNTQPWVQGCKGVKVYEPVVFYPVHYSASKKYFKEGFNLTFTEQTYAHHMWNKMTYQYQVPEMSPYAKLAKRYCPDVYAVYKETGVL